MVKGENDQLTNQLRSDSRAFVSVLDRRCQLFLTLVQIQSGQSIQ